MHMEKLIKDLASALRQAESAREPIAPLTAAYGDLTEIQAYAIQHTNTGMRIAAGERIVGKKIGLTSLAVQKQLGVDQPDFGTLFASMSHGDGEPICLSELIQPKVEAEVALILGKDLTHERHTFADIIRATDCAVVGIEVVDSRIADWKIRYADTVADNGSSARFVLGSRPALLRNVDLGECFMTMRQDKKVLVDGNGSACMGNPLNAAVWLANRMVREGTPLRAGDIVLTGALGPMVAVTAPGTYEVHIDGLGGARAVFE